MPELVCDTSSLQYLHQIRHLFLLEKLASSIWIPPAVADELAVGRQRGYDVPDVSAFAWMQMRTPVGEAALPMAYDLGRGEAEVLALCLEDRTRIAVLDDALARRIAVGLGVKIRGTLGVLLDAKRMGLIPRVGPLLDELVSLRFWITAETRSSVLRIAGESVG